MKLVKLLAAISISVCSILAQATPITPLAFTSGLNTGYSVTGISSVDGNVDWFVFDANGTTNYSFWFDRTVAAPDLIAGLYSGDTTGFDYAAAGAGVSYSYSQAGFYNTALLYIGYWDDTHEDIYGGPYGDPDFSTTLAAGRYSLALSSLNEGGLTNS